jgi:hypothetical protein
MISLSCDAAGEELDRSDEEPCGCRRDGLLEVFCEPAVSADPCEGPFDDPSPRQHLEALGKIVEQSHLPAKRTLNQLGIARRTFYRWYDRYLEGGPEALQDRPSAPSRVWNRIGEDIQDQIIEMALEADATNLSPRELALRFTDEKRYFVSESTVYRLLKAHDLITSPAFVVIKAADQFHTKTTHPNEMWQTDFTYFKIIGWG